MVTLKKREGLAPFSAIIDGRLYESEITRAFDTTIKNFHKTWYVLEPIWSFVIMPDHLHLLLKIAPGEKRAPLGSLVYQLMKALALDYWRVAGGKSDEAVVGKADEAAFSSTGTTGACAPKPVFERDWHDWIVKRDGQLANFIDYIRENPARHWQRKQNRDFFRVYSGVRFLSREWFAYGNLELLKLPVFDGSSLFALDCRGLGGVERVARERASPRARLGGCRHDSLALREGNAR